MQLHTTIMILDKELKREFEKDKSRLAELNKEYANHEDILLENLYVSKKQFQKISDEKHASHEKWKALIKSAVNTSSLPEPAEFKAIDNHGKKRTIKIGPNTKSHDVKRAMGMHDASKYDKREKRELAEWSRNREDFGARMGDILKRKNRILGFSSSDNYFDSCFDEASCNPHTVPSNLAYHTSFRQPSPDLRLEEENSRLLDQVKKFRDLEDERDRLLKDNEALYDSLKSTQELMRQVAENRDEHVQTNRRYAEENRKLERALEALKGNSARRVAFDDYDDDNLREEVKTLSNSLAKVKEEPHYILRDVGVESRLEFLQSSKASEHSEHHHNSISSGLNINFNTPSISSGTGSSHRGNVRADAALLFIDASHRAKFEKTFEDIYGMSVDEVKEGRGNKYAPASKATEIANLRGTMAHRGYFTKHTPDRDAEDQFLTLLDYCESEYKEAIRGTSTALRAAQVFSENADVINSCERMLRICDIVVGTSRVNPRPRGHYMSGGLNS
ncbi:hypothetical protein NHQ30_005603 [Ciborinia camelliae]|nr:hypothetical protein NHQ30_005603 [Ciborinia camelliae]